MLAGPNIGVLKAGSNGAAELRFLRYFDTPGSYRVWVRGRGDTNAAGEGKNDSVHVGLNGQLAAAGTAIQHFPDSWHWSNSLRGGGAATVVIPSAGLHVVNVWMREDGLLVDSVLLTLDTSLDPNVSEPADAGDPGGTGSAGNPVLAVLDGIGTIEVENFDYQSAGSGHAWQPLTRSGADALQASPNTGVLLPTASNSPEVAFDVYFDEPGEYRVWVRGWGDTNAAGEGKNDSVHVGVDGTLDGATAMDQFPPDWSWSSSRRAGGIPLISVPGAGMHRVSVWMREDGFVIDKLVLVRSDLATVPGGSGPAVRTFDGDTGPLWTP